MKNGKALALVSAFGLLITGGVARHLLHMNHILKRFLHLMVVRIQGTKG